LEETEAQLAPYREQVLTEIERHLPTREPLRWLYGPLADYPRRPGKGLRAALCLATCSAYGGSRDDALAAAAAIELLHNAFLVHDDIEDASAWRRGAPTLHRSEGIPLALNAGDALAVLSFEVMASAAGRLGRRMAAQLVEELTNAVWQTLEGQALELGWRRDGITDLTPDDYVDLVLRKSCWYTTIAPMRIGAHIGSWGSADLRPITRFGVLLGTAFQITDDLLNLTGSHHEYGKEIGGDLREGKRSLMLIHLLAVADAADHAKVVELLRRDQSEPDEDEVAWLVGLLAGYGSIEFGRCFARGVAEGAADAFADAFAGAVCPAEADIVARLVDYVVERAR
jgi:geranylgeranyl diphosphate synthase type II